MRKSNNKFFGTPEEIAALKAKHERGEPLTLDETSKVMGISRSAVRAIEVRALQKIKSQLKKYGIKNFDDVFGGDTKDDTIYC